MTRWPFRDVSNRRVQGTYELPRILLREVMRAATVAQIDRDTITVSMDLHVCHSVSFHSSVARAASACEMSPFFESISSQSHLPLGPAQTKQRML
jgi:hypothetical protein